eukprot:1138492-Pyramimonas_sp.AAC.1
MAELAPLQITLRESTIPGPSLPSIIADPHDGDVITKTANPVMGRTDAAEVQATASPGEQRSNSVGNRVSSQSDLAIPQNTNLRGVIRPVSGHPSSSGQATEQALETDSSRGSTVPNANAPPEQLKPSQKARLKAMNFKLGQDKVNDLLAKEVDVVLSELLLEMRGSISCGGRPIMNFREFDDIKAVSEHLSEVIPQRNDLLEKAGNGKSLGKCA